MVRATARSAVSGSESTRMNDAVPDPHEQATGGFGKPSFPDAESMGRVLEAGGVGVWSWDVKTDVVTWMGKLAQVHGIDTRDWSGSFADFQKVIHFEDQREVIAA